MMKKLSEWLDEGFKGSKEYQFTTRVKLKDGTTLSIQAGEANYCKPRCESPINSYSFYMEFEVGFPSVEIAELLPFAEYPSEPTDTVYGYVPVKIIEDAISKRGGIVGFDSRGSNDER